MQNPPHASILLTPYPSLLLAADLEGFAGAGLYSSVPLTPLRLSSVRYADESLLWDDAGRDALLTRLAEVGAAVEAACGGPQDVEGVETAEGKVAVVQARPQVVK